MQGLGKSKKAIEIEKQMGYNRIDQYEHNEQ